MRAALATARRRDPNQGRPRRSEADLDREAGDRFSHRGRIERVLDAAKALGHRSGENPAAWRGNLKNLLPAPRKLSRGHHAAMAYEDVPAFIARLGERPAVAALALEWTILTAARSAETLGASWGKIDFKTKVWTVPAKRMKSGREHRVPLSQRALEILAEVEKLRIDAKPERYLFPGQRTFLGARDGGPGARDAAHPAGLCEALQSSQSSGRGDISPPRSGGVGEAGGQTRGYGATVRDGVGKTSEMSKRRERAKAVWT
jgi:integrase